MAIFNTYVSLPEGNIYDHYDTSKSSEIRCLKPGPSGSGWVEPIHWCEMKMENIPSTIESEPRTYLRGDSHHQHVGHSGHIFLFF
jgi:hypothetical protein